MTTESGGELAGLAPELARRIASILGAVESEADRLIEEARAQAEEQIEIAKRQADGLVAERQRRIAELSDGIVESAESVLQGLDETAPIRDSFDRLIEALGQAADRLTAEIESGSEAPAGESDAPPATGRGAKRARWRR